MASNPLCEFGMDAFGRLSTELISLILAQLDVDHAPRVSLRNANLVCRRWNEVVTPMLFRRVVFLASRKRDERSIKTIDFLNAREDVRKCVHEIYVPVRNQWIHADLSDGLAKLLPLLPNLGLVELDGDSNILGVGEEEEYSDPEDEEPNRNNEVWYSFQKGLLDSLGRLAHPPLISVDKYWQTLDSSLSLTDYDNIFALNAGLVHQTLHDERQKRPPSQDLELVLARQKRLKYLHLTLTALTSQIFPQAHPWEMHQREQALERLVPSMKSLVSLGLTGDFVLSDTAWSTWRQEVHWSGLKVLNIHSQNLVEALSSRLSGLELPQLHTVKLDLYSNLGSDEEYPVPDTPPSVVSFLKGLPALEELSLWGFRPQTIQDYLSTSHRASKLRRLRFHVFEKHSDLLLRSSHIDEIGMRCPRLEWLGIDVDHSDLVRATATSKAHQGADGDFELLASLARLTRLVHVRLFLHREPRPQFRLEDVLATFQRLRGSRSGPKLESLAVCFEMETLVQLWDFGRDHEVLVRSYKPSMVGAYELSGGLQVCDLRTRTVVGSCDGQKGLGQRTAAHQTADFEWNLESVGHGL